MSEALPATAWQRWQMQRVLHAAPPCPAKPEAGPLWPGPTPPTETLDAQALARAQTQGHAQGLAEGHAQGLVQGREEGFALGRAQALQESTRQARDEAQAALQAQALGLQALTQAWPQALVQAEEALASELMDLALALAQQVLGQALAADPLLMLAAVRELLQTEPALTGQPQLLLHPEDLALVREHLAEELQAAGWRLRAETGLARGGCRVLAASGELDASLPTRWQRVTAALACEPVLAQVRPPSS